MVTNESENEIHLYSYQPKSGLSVVSILDKIKKRFYSVSIDMDRVAGDIDGNCKVVNDFKNNDDYVELSASYFD